MRADVRGEEVDPNIQLLRRVHLPDTAQVQKATASLSPNVPHSSSMTALGSATLLNQCDQTVQMVGTFRPAQSVSLAMRARVLQFSQMLSIVT